MGRFGLALLAAALLLRAGPHREAALEAELARIAADSGGVVGVSAVHVESGARASLRGGDRFPMMSSYKFPIALQLLHRVERGEVSLEKSVSIRPSDLRLGWSPLADTYKTADARRTVEELFESMLVESDNTASDLVLREAGGPGAVTARVRELGVAGVRIDRPEGRLALDHAGAETVPPSEEWTLERLRRIFDAVPDDRRRVSARAYAEDPRDTATPDAMADLLALVWRGKALGGVETRRLLGAMTRSRPGADRLKGSLPPGTAVAHKPGTSATFQGFTEAVNDIGIVTLPEGAGHLAIAVFVKATQSPVAKEESVIAQISRACYDRWTRDRRR